MSVRMRITSSKTRSRRSHHKTDGPTLTVSAEGGVRRRHFMDPSTGEYRGKQIAKVAGTRAHKRADTAQPKASEASAKAKASDAKQVASEEKKTS